jgi:hypothetical protein
VTTYRKYIGKIILNNIHYGQKILKIPSKIIYDKNKKLKKF